VTVCLVPRGVGDAGPDGRAEAEWDGVGAVAEVEARAVEDAVVDDAVVDDAVVGRWVGWTSCPDLAGLNVATESIAPATRQTARMLASSGMMVPLPPNGADSRRSRLRRRFARSSRW
jgi:hypothetical protein